MEAMTRKSGRLTPTGKTSNADDRGSRGSVSVATVNIASRGNR